MANPLLNQGGPQITVDGYISINNKNNHFTVEGNKFSDLKKTLKKYYQSLNTNNITNPGGNSINDSTPINSKFLLVVNRNRIMLDNDYGTSQLLAGDVDPLSARNIVNRINTLQRGDLLTPSSISQQPVNDIQPFKSESSELNVRDVSNVDLYTQNKLETESTITISNLEVVYITIDGG